MSNIIFWVRHDPILRHGREDDTSCLLEAL